MELLRNYKDTYVNLARFKKQEKGMKIELSTLQDDVSETIERHDFYLAEIKKVRQRIHRSDIANYLDQLLSQKIGIEIRNEAYVHFLKNLTLHEKNLLMLVKGSVIEEKLPVVVAKEKQAMFKLLGTGEIELIRYVEPSELKKHETIGFMNYGIFRVVTFGTEQILERIKTDRLKIESRLKLTQQESIRLRDHLVSEIRYELERLNPDFWDAQYSSTSSIESIQRRIELVTSDLKVGDLKNATKTLAILVEEYDQCISNSKIVLKEAV